MFTHTQSLFPLKEDEFIKLNIGLKVPKIYDKFPLISNLVNHFKIHVVIVDVVIGKSDNSCGWFDLELYGTCKQLDNVLIYLSALKITLMYLKFNNSYFCQ